MTYTLERLEDELTNYRPANDIEARQRESIVRFLARCRENGANPFCRSTREGHITASAWVVDPAAGQVLLVHHRKLNKWLQPGGHCDGEADILAAALREVEEETGLTNIHTAGGIFDVDAHEIPACVEDPAHVHYDIRFLMLGNSSEQPVASAESRAVRWMEFEDIPRCTTEESVLRMVLKTSHGGGA